MEGLNSVDVYLLINAGLGTMRNERFPYLDDKRNHRRWLVHGAQTVK
jgi:hypothetical protein